MAATRRSSKDRKVPKSCRLSPAKVAAAQRILGTPTATETIEAALADMAIAAEAASGRSRRAEAFAQSKSRSSSSPPA